LDKFPGGKAMRALWLILLAGVSLAGAKPAAEKAVNLSGAWIIDSDQSESKHTSPEIPKINIGGGRDISRGSIEYPESPNGYDGNDSPAESPARQMGDLTLMIVQTDGELQVIRKFTAYGKEWTVPQTFALDGSQCINLASDGRGGFMSRTRWQNNKLINSGTETRTVWDERIEISLTEEYAISKNEKKLTIKTMSITPRGVTMLKQVFNKLEKSKS
jgi:hypothetical protein